jgi:hypothetical protein
MKEMFSAGSSTSTSTATASPPGAAATVRSAAGITAASATASAAASTVSSGSPKSSRGKSVGFSLPGDDSSNGTSAVTSPSVVDSPVTPLQLAPVPEQPCAVAQPLSDSW